MPKANQQGESDISSATQGNVLQSQKPFTARSNHVERRSGVIDGETHGEDDTPLRPSCSGYDEVKVWDCLSACII